MANNIFKPIKITSKATQQEPQQQETHFTAPYDKTSQTILRGTIAVNSKNPIIENIIENTGTITIPTGSKIIIKDPSNNKISVNSFGVLLKAREVFAQLNYYDTGKKKKLKTSEIRFSLKEFAKECGIKEDKNSMDNFRKQVNKDLEFLFNCKLTIEGETVKGKNNNNKDFIDRRLIISKGVEKGQIFLELHHFYANYLIQQSLTQYPKKIYSLSGRNPRAKFLLTLLEEHYNMPTNQKKGTADILKVENIVNKLDFPSLSSTGVKAKGWVKCIKEKLEECFDRLTQENYLKDWHYSHAKKLLLDEFENDKLEKWGYHNWLNTYIYFVPASEGRYIKTKRLEFQNK